MNFSNLEKNPGIFTLFLKIAEDLKQERQEVKQILKDEFGNWFKKDKEFREQLNEGAAADAKSRATANMPSLAASSGSEGGVPAAQEAIAAQSGNNGFQRQQVIGSGAPIRTMLGNMRGRRGR